MTAKEQWVEIAEVLPSKGEVIIGVLTTPAMIEAGVEALERLMAAGADSADIVEAVHFAMRQQAGEGRALRRVRS